MPDITTTITYRERFYHDVRLRNNVGRAVKESDADDGGFDTYAEAVEDAAKFGVHCFEIRKVFVRVDA